MAGAARDKGLTMVKQECTGFLRDGDRIRLDVGKGTLDVLVDKDEFDARKAGFEPLPPRYTSGVLAKYTKLVGSAAVGAVCS